MCSRLVLLIRIALADFPRRNSNLLFSWRRNHVFFLLSFPLFMNNNGCEFRSFFMSNEQKKKRLRIFVHFFYAFFVHVFRVGMNKCGIQRNLRLKMKFNIILVKWISINFMWKWTFHFNRITIFERFCVCVCVSITLFLEKQTKLIRMKWKKKLNQMKWRAKSSSTNDLKFSGNRKKKKWIKSSKILFHLRSFHSSNYGHFLTSHRLE